MLSQSVPLLPKGMMKRITAMRARTPMQAQRMINSLVLVFLGVLGVGLVVGMKFDSRGDAGVIGGSEVGSGATFGAGVDFGFGVGSGVGVGVGSGVGVGVGFGVGSGAGSGVDCGVILFGDPCPLGVKLLLSMMLLYYTFYV